MDITAFDHFSPRLSPHAQVRHRVNRASASSSTVSQSDRRGRTSRSANSNRNTPSRLTRPDGTCEPASGG